MPKAPKFTEQDHYLIIQLSAEGKTNEEIAQLLGRTKHAIQNRKSLLKITTPKEPKPCYLRDQTEMYVRELLDFGFSVQAIAKRLGKTPDEIHQLIVNSKRGAIL